MHNIHHSKLEMLTKLQSIFWCEVQCFIIYSVGLYIIVIKGEPSIMTHVKIEDKNRLLVLILFVSIYIKTYYPFLEMKSLDKMSYNP